MPITKRPCSNCPFRADAGAIELRPGRLEGIVADLLQDDQQTFVPQDTRQPAHDVRWSCRGDGEAGPVAGDCTPWARA